MVSELAARHALPKEVVEGVTERTGGVLLFVEEVTRLLLERGEQGGIQAIPWAMDWASFVRRLRNAATGRRYAETGVIAVVEFVYLPSAASPNRSSGSKNARYPFLPAYA
jgi:hypothetical protein